MPAARLIVPIVLALLLPAAGAAQQAERVPVDVELVLAVDTSRSMDGDELRLQREGYAAALEHPAVVSALGMGPLGRAAIMYLEWGGPGRQRVLVDWTLVAGPEDAARIAAELRAQPIAGLRGTSISGAIDRGIAELEGNRYDGARRVIDISGDGPNNMGSPVLEARARAISRGIAINGLPFMVKRPGGAYSIPDLDIYYETCVIAGDSAFVIPIHGMERLVVSIRQKLVLEIAGLAPARPERLRAASATDCLIGEKLRQNNRFLP